MKVFVLPVGTELQPQSQPFRYPQHNADYGVEQDFLRWLSANPQLLAEDPDDADWQYLPVFWTRWHLNHDYARRGRDELAAAVSSAIRDDSRTFTVCQYDDGPLAPIGETTVLLSSRRGERGVDIPLLSSPLKPPTIPVRRRYLATFVGRVDTHPVRRELASAVADRPDIRIVDRQRGTRRYVRLICSSLVAFAPRGYGGNSFRFYEAAQLGSVPMLIGDLDTRPFKRTIDWSAASLYAPDAAIALEILDQCDPVELRRMGAEAARVWQEELTFGRWCRHALADLGDGPPT